MESIVENKAWDTGKPVTDARLRIQSRPQQSQFKTADTGSRRSRMAAVEDLGSSLAPRKTNKSKPESGMKSGRPLEVGGPRLEKFTLSSSEDELDTLSQHTADDETHYGRKVKKDVSGWVDGASQVDGCGQASATEKRLDTSEALKKLKFKKNKPTGNAEPSQLSDLSTSQNSALKTSEENYPSARDLPGRKPGGDSQGRAPSPFTQPSFPKKRSSSPRRRVPQAKSQEDVTMGGNSENTRPKPRPSGKLKNAAKQVPQPFPDLGSPVSTPSERRQTVSRTEGLSSRKKTAAAVTIKKPGYARERLVNSFSPGKCPDDTSLRPGEPSILIPLGSQSRKEKVPLPRQKGLVKKVQEIPEFPTLSPLSGQGTGSGKNAKGETRSHKASRRVVVSETDNSDEEVETVQEPLKPQPFPMSTQVLASIGSSPTAGPSSLGEKREGRGSNLNKGKPFPMSTQDLESIGSSSIAGSSGSGSSRVEAQPFPMTLYGDGLPCPAVSVRKRRLTGSDDEHESKKRKDQDAEPEILNDYSYEGDEDAIIISPTTDPRTLCPYCDAPLPPSPTPRLKGLLAATEKKSYREARPANPLGRKAPFSVFISVCQRHRFESQILPEAELKGWPKSIEWSELGTRVKKMRDVLRALIDDSGETEPYDDDWTFDARPRQKCVFWKEIIAEVKQKGSRAVTGVRGQFATFEKGQPGYYGELGSVIIHQTLYDLFPPASTDAAAVAPLTANEFIQRVLVPEVGLRLIMEDKELDDDTAGMAEAVKILRESASYGVAMFPADDREEGDDGARNATELGVADRMMMERARKRRKELEEEEQSNAESELDGRESEVGSRVLRATKKAKAKEREKSKKGRAKAPEPVQPVVPPRPRPRPIGKNASIMSLASDVEVPSLEPKNSDPVIDTDVEVEPASSPRSQRRTISQSSVECFAEEPPPRRSKRQISRAPSEVDINLCSSSDDVSVQSGSGSRKYKSRRKAASETMTDPAEPPDELGKISHTVSSMKTPRPARTWASLKDLEIGDMDDTPRPLKHRSSSSSSEAKASWEVHPLQIARARKPREGAAPPVASLFNNITSTSSRDRSHSWLLSDTSRSSMESIRN